MARPTIMDEPLRRAVEQCIVMGMTHKATCQLLGIAPGTFYRWGARGLTELDRREDPYYPRNVQENPYCAFRETIENARAESIRKALETVQDFATGFDVVTTTDEEGSTPQGHTSRSVTKVTRVRSWQAGAWLLERLDPESYGRTNRTVLSSDPEAPVQVTHKIEDVDVGALTRVVSILAESGVLPPELAAGDPDEAGPVDDAEGLTEPLRPADPDPETEGVPPH